MSFDGFARLNAILGGCYRIAWLNVLWLVMTIAGLGVIGAGPASYAMAKYIDRWFRLGETPPVAATFGRYAREQPWRAIRTSWVLLGAGVVIAVNLLGVSNWYLRAANVVALAILMIIGAYIYFVMAAVDVAGVRSLLSTALLVGLGSLHWTIIGATAVTLTYWLMFRFALPLVVMFGVGVPAAVVGFIVRGVFRDLAAEPNPDDAGQNPADAADPGQRTPTPTNRNDAVSTGLPWHTDHQADLLTKGSAG